MSLFSWTSKLFGQKSQSITSTTTTTTSSTRFINAALVGLPEDTLYSVLVDDGKIVSIKQGATDDTDSESTDNGVTVVDLRQQDGSSQWLSPSLIDWHTHFTMNTLTIHRLDLQTAVSAAETLERVRVALTDPNYDEDGRFVAINLRVGTWPDLESLTRQSLDNLSDTVPIFLVFNGYHSICCNTPALVLAGHEPKGHDGTLYEAEAFAVSRHKLQVNHDVTDKWVFAEAEKAAALGVTEIVDLEMNHNLPDWQRRYTKGFRSLRVHIGFYTDHIDDAISLGLKTGDPIPGTDGLILTGPFKVVTDGGLGSQTAFCHDHYPNTDSYGILAEKPESLAVLCKRATEHGLRLAVHAIGDHALKLTLETLAAGPRPLAGSTIEHAQLVTLDDLALFRQLGLIASVQPRHLVDDRELCHKFWPGREGRAYAFKSIVDAGIPIKLGSDCPVAPLQPWEAMAVAISRAGEGEVAFCEEQIIDLPTAFAASTSNGKTHIVEGDRADLVVLGSDPLKADAQALRAMHVEATMLGGNWTFRR